MAKRIAVGVVSITGEALRDAGVDVGRLMLERMDRELKELGADPNVDYVLVGVTQGHAGTAGRAIIEALNVEVER